MQVHLYDYFIIIPTETRIFMYFYQSLRSTDTIIDN